MTRLYDRLLARGSVARLGEPPASRPELPDLDMTLRRIRRLVQQDS